MSLLSLPPVSAQALDFATEGRASVINQRNWIKRGLFSTPIPPAEPGRERMFPRLAAYEAALLGWAAENGLPLKILSSAFSWRRRQAIISQAKSGFAGEVLENAIADGALPEFQRPDNDDPVYWIILLTKPADDAEGFRAVLPARRGDLAAQMAKFDETEAEAVRVVINVSSIVNAVEYRLASRHTDHED